MLFPACGRFAPVPGTKFVHSSRPAKAVAALVLGLFVLMGPQAGRCWGEEEPPEIEEDYYGLPSGARSLVARAGVLANDTLPSGPVQARVIHGPSEGTLKSWNEREGTFTYEAGKDWKGTDHFDYEVRWQGRPVGSARVTIGTRYKGYTWYVDCCAESGPEPSRPRGGFLLVGGLERKKELDKAYVWMIQHVNGNAPADGKSSLGGSILVLTVRTAPVERTVQWIRKTAEERNLRLRSVESIVFDALDAGAAREAALHDSRIGRKLREADAVFMPGGDQRAYLNLWRGSQVQEILNQRIKEGNVLVGGSSAGLHVLAETVTAPRLRPNLKPNTVGGTPGITNREALSHPRQLDGMLESNFLHAGYLQQQHVITESHFRQRNWFETDSSMRGRMGRLLAFMARLTHDQPDANPVHGLGIEETTALLVERDGKAAVVGKGCAYFVTAGSHLHYGTAKDGRMPLSWEKIGVQKVRPGGTFDLKRWQALTGGEDYTITVREGALLNVADPRRDVYNNPHRNEPEP